MKAITLSSCLKITDNIMSALKRTPPPHSQATSNTTPARLPTVAQVSQFIQSICPSRTGDVNFAFHSPRIRVRSQDPDSDVVPSFTFIDPYQNRSVASHVVLSITPTPGFYHAVHHHTHTHANSHPGSSPSVRIPRKPPRSAPLTFLHRPWTLDRRSMPRNATVLACHKGFDEYLTVGNNAALGKRLGMVVEQCAVIQGYKGDPERTIGLVGRVAGMNGEGVGREEILRVLEREFGAFEGVFGFGGDGEGREGGDEGSDAQGGGVSLVGNADSEGSQASRQPGERANIRVIAIMNAFHPAEVEQVEAITKDLLFELKSADASGAEEGRICDDVLYLTGAVREPGLLAAKEKGMAVVCVGHRICEEWGIRYLAGLLRQKWPGLRVDEVLEEESLGKDVEAGKPIVQTRAGEAVVMTSVK